MMTMTTTTMMMIVEAKVKNSTDLRDKVQATFHGKFRFLSSQKGETNECHRHDNYTLSSSERLSLS